MVKNKKREIKFLRKLNKSYRRYIDNQIIECHDLREDNYEIQKKLDIAKIDLYVNSFFLKTVITIAIVELIIILF